MKINRFSRIEAKDESGPATPERMPDLEDESDFPRSRQPSWEPSTWIKPPTKSQLMAGR
jgi:hypothetical protein